MPRAVILSFRVPSSAVLMTLRGSCVIGQHRIDSLAGRKPGLGLLETDRSEYAQRFVVLIDRVPHHVINDEDEIEIDKVQQWCRQP